MKGISECISKLLRTFGKRRSDKTNQSYSALPCRRFSVTEIKTATNNFDDNLFIGCCGDWKVYNGFIDDPVRSVAISRVNIKSMQGFHEFRTEVLVLCQVRHPNLVSFIGYCLAKRYGFLVYEFMVNSNLARHLNGTNPDPNPNPISWKRRLQICVGVARGLHYLHTGLKHTVVHSGVDPINILLDAKWEAKLSNLGLSKMGPLSLSKALIRIETDRVVGTYGYMDQEYVMFGKLNDKSDVYSFGVVLLQLLSGITPSPFAVPMDLVGLARKGKREGTIYKIIDPYLMGKIAPECFMVYVDIATSCVRNRGERRPTMGEVQVRLERALELQESADAATGDCNYCIDEYTCNDSSGDASPIDMVSVKSRILATYPDAFTDDSKGAVVDRRSDLEIPQ
uniref:Protein kinase domain-containing protein n=1 Tax=Quercus lobata TaxID=97700 RepID=A0A7N2LSD3_QUELO